MPMAFWRRNRWLRARRGLNTVVRDAILEAGHGGTDSLHLLSAALRTPRVAAVIADLATDPDAFGAAVRSHRPSKSAGPGLTDDAKAAIEATTHRALVVGADPDVLDLLVGLATANCQARQALNAQEINRDRLLARLGSGAGT